MSRCGALPLLLVLLAACNQCEGGRSTGSAALRARHRAQSGSGRARRHSRLAALRRHRLLRKRTASHSGFLNFTAEPKEGSLSVAEALERVPVHVSDLFTQVKASSSAAQAAQLLQELNVVYERAQNQRDRLGFACSERRSESDRMVRDARASLREAEVQLTLLQDRSRKMQLGIDHSLAEVNRLQEQFVEHRDSCAKSRQRNHDALALVAKDLPLARALSAEVTSPCTGGGGGSPPRLVECSLPDGFIVAFKDSAQRNKTARLSGLSEKLLSLNLDRTARGHGRKQAAASSGRLRGSTPFFLQLSSIPSNLCADVQRPPTCEMFVDDMGTFVGNVEDLANELKVRAAAEEEHCQNSQEAYDDQIQTLKRQADTGNVELVNALAEKSTVQAMRLERRAQLLRISKEAKHGMEECERDITALSTTMCSTKRLRTDLGATGAFLGDCEVSDWVLEPCSKTCGSGGVQNMTRQVITAPAGAQRRCPPLTGTRACNERPCPVDGATSRWGPWSECSRACGGGTRTRSRTVLREPKHGGLPTGETLQERICNERPCDADCTLFPWSDWSPCSKACNTGHRVRRRAVRQGVLGDGKCPSAEAPERYDAQRCNETACAAGRRCNSTLDLVFALDSSGSAGALGLGAARNFTRAVVSRMGFGGQLAKAGAVYFGNAATEVQALTANASILQSSLASVPWTKENTNSGEALALAAQMLERDGRPGAVSAIVVITDGMPVSSFIMSTVAKRQKSLGVRVLFVLVGSGLSKQAVKSWASQPESENIVKVPDYASLGNQTKVTELLANLCPSLV